MHPCFGVATYFAHQVRSGAVCFGQVYPGGDVVNCPFCGREVRGRRLDHVASIPGFQGGQGGLGPVPASPVPSRAATLEGDVAVPVCQAVFSGILAGVPAAAVSMALEGPWWAGPAVLAGVTAGVWAVLLYDHRQLLRIRLKDITLPAVRAAVPSEVRVEVTDREARSMRYVDLPVGDDILQAVAVAVLGGQRPFSRRGLSGVVSEGDFNRLSGAMMEGGLARYRDGKPQAGIELTGSGRAVLRHYL